MPTHNSTCAITQAPILPGEPVVGVVLTPTRHHERVAAGLKGSGISLHSPFGYTSPTALWTPVCTPLHGTYDGYGGVDHIEMGESWDNQASFWKREEGLNVNAHASLRDFIRFAHHRGCELRPALMLIHLSVWNTIQVHIREVLLWSGTSIRQSVKWDLDYLKGGVLPDTNARNWYYRIAGLEQCEIRSPHGLSAVGEQMYLYYALKDMRKLYQPQSGQDQNENVHLLRKVLRAGIYACDVQDLARGINTDDCDSEY